MINGIKTFKNNCKWVIPNAIKTSLFTNYFSFESPQCLWSKIFCVMRHGLMHMRWLCSCFSLTHHSICVTFSIKRHQINLSSLEKLVQWLPYYHKHLCAQACFSGHFVDLSTWCKKFSTCYLFNVGDTIFFIDLFDGRTLCIVALQAKSECQTLNSAAPTYYFCL